MAYHLTAGDSPKDVKFGTQLVIIDIILHILDVEVNALILAQRLHLGLLMGATLGRRRGRRHGRRRASLAAGDSPKTSNSARSMSSSTSSSTFLLLRLASRYFLSFGVRSRRRRRRHCLCQSIQ